MRYGAYNQCGLYYQAKSHPVVPGLTRDRWRLGRDVPTIVTLNSFVTLNLFVTLNSFQGPFLLQAPEHGMDGQRRRCDSSQSFGAWGEMGAETSSA